MLEPFLEGTVIGFSIAAPVGPIGLLCIQRTIRRGRPSGLASGLGAATADAVYGGVAGFGITSVSSFLMREQLWVRLLGGAFLILIGARILLSNPKGSASAQGGQQGLARDYVSTFLLTLSNPMTILTFASVFIGLGLVGQTADFTTAILLVSGVFAGSGLWWTVLANSVGMIRGRFDQGYLRWVNRLSGLAIVAYGLVALVRLTT